MNFATIKKFDVANGPGVRVSLFVSGCTHHCKGCFNSVAWDFDYGSPFTDAEIETIIEAMRPDYIKGFSLLGGEPFEAANQPKLADLLELIKREYPNKTVWCYSGYSLTDELLPAKVGTKENIDRMLACIDVLVDGEFVEELKDLNLRFCGSSNQRIIDLPATLKNNNVVLWDGREE